MQCMNVLHSSFYVAKTRFIAWVTKREVQMHVGRFQEVFCPSPSCSLPYDHPEWYANLTGKPVPAMYPDFGGPVHSTRFQTANNTSAGLIRSHVLYAIHSGRAVLASVIWKRPFSRCQHHELIALALRQAGKISQMVIRKMTYSNQFDQYSARG